MIRYFDKFGDELNYTDFIELQWNRKLYEAGSFVLYMAAEHYNPRIKYIQNEDRPETGIVQKVEFEETSRGKFITLSGFFIEKLLDMGAFTTTQIMDATGAKSSAAVEEGIRILLYNCFKQETSNLKNSINPASWGVLALDQFAQPCLYETILRTGSHYPTDCTITFEAGEPFGATLYEFCKNNNNGYTATPRFNPSADETKPLIGIEIEMLNGRDLTKDVYFGPQFGDVSNIETVFDDSGVKTFYVAMQVLPEDIKYSDMKSVCIDGKWQNVIYETFTEPKNSPSDLGECKPVRCIKTNVSDITASNEQTVRSQMREQLKLDMLNYYKVETVAVDVIQNRFYYLRDYDLGDNCSVVLETGGLYSAQIIEINEVHRNNKVEVQIVLGTARKRKVVK